jgi:hypothetical protein
VDARHSRGVRWVNPVGPGLERVKVGRGHDETVRGGLSLRRTFVRDVDHPQFSGGVDVRELTLHFSTLLNLSKKN